MKEELKFEEIKTLESVLKEKIDGLQVTTFLIEVGDLYLKLKRMEKSSEV